jgi:serine/threonine protein kinase
MILQHLRAGNVNHPGRKFVFSLLHKFSLSGPNGHHLCLVSEVGGCSITESKENNPDFMFPLGTAKAIAAQVTMGLAYMHSNGMGHGGESGPYCTGDSSYWLIAKYDWLGEA